MGIPLADLLAGVFSAIAVLAGVEGRNHSGTAERFDLAMFDVMVEMLAHVGTLYLNTGQEQEPQGSAHPFITPWQAFRCADDRWIVVAPREEHFWPRLCRALELPELLDRPEFADAKARHANRDLLLPVLTKRLAERSAGTWLELLRAAGVPAGPVNRFPAVFGDPQVAVRRMVRRFELDGSVYETVGDAFKRAGHPDPEVVAPPRLGQHTEQVVGGLPGYDAGRVAELRAAGAFGPHAPPGPPPGEIGP
jgi:formyl-CoA transferase